MREVLKARGSQIRKASVGMCTAEGVCMQEVGLELEV